METGPVRRRRWLCLLALLLIGCGVTAAPPSSARPQPASACVIDTGEVAPSSISVAVAEPVDAAHAPAPRNSSERFIFGQLYETLVWTDCAGNVLPGLAEAWSTDERGHEWQFRLRAGVTFWDGSEVTARAVVDSWGATPHVSARISTALASVTAVGEHELRATLREPARQPYVFAHPDFAVARGAADGSWPIGSGPYRIDARADPLGTRVVVRALSGRGPPEIVFHSFSRADPRAPLDAGADVLVTADPSAIAYARALRDYTITPLPWSRTYALVTPVTRQTPGASVTPPEDVVAALARDAVPTGTRPAVPTFWWLEPACRRTSGALAAQPPRPRGASSIAYPHNDAVARGIAERLVALAWPVSRAPAWLRAVLPDDYGAAGAPVANAAEERAAIESLQTGRALAFVVPLPRSMAAACAAAAVGEGSTALTLLGTDEWVITPLLDAHDYIVYRRSPGTVTVEAAGTIRFGGGER